MLEWMACVRSKVVCVGAYGSAREGELQTKTPYNTVIHSLHEMWKKEKWSTLSLSLLQLATIADIVVSACPSLPILCRFTGRLCSTCRTLCLLPLLRIPCPQDPHRVHQHRHHLGYDCMWLTLDLRLHFPTGNEATYLSWFTPSLVSCPAGKIGGKIRLLILCTILGTSTYFSGMQSWH